MQCFAMSPDPVFDIPSDCLGNLIKSQPAALAPGYDHPLDQRSQEHTLVTRPVYPGFLVHSAGAQHNQVADGPDPRFHGFECFLESIFDHTNFKMIFESGRIQDQDFIHGMRKACQGIEDIGEPETVVRSGGRLVILEQEIGTFLVGPAVERQDDNHGGDSQLRQLDGLLARTAALGLPNRAALNVKVGDYSGAQVIASQPLEPLPSFATGETKQPLERILRRNVGWNWTLSS